MGFNFTNKRIDQLYENVLGNGTRDLNYMIWKGAFWVQYHKCNVKAFPNHVKSNPEWLLKIYSELNINVLKSIFELGVKADPKHFNDGFFQDILDRRDQLLNSRIQNRKSAP